MKSATFPAAVASTLFLASCADRPVIYTGSGLSVLHLQGVKQSIPEKMKIGYERSEYAWLPKGGKQTVKSGFDGEYRDFAGVAISDLLLTGEAAVGKSIDTPASPTQNQSQIISTNTRFNLGLEVVPSDGASPSFNAGFKRSVLALFPSSEGELPSTYTDLSIHTSGFPSVPKFLPEGVEEDRHLTTSDGARVVQTIATGAAASELGKRNREGIGKRIGVLLAKPEE